MNDKLREYDPDFIRLPEDSPIEVYKASDLTLAGERAIEYRTRRKHPTLIGTPLGRKMWPTLISLAWCLRWPHLTVRTDEVSALCAQRTKLVGANGTMALDVWTSTNESRPFHLIGGSGAGSYTLRFCAGEQMYEEQERFLSRFLVNLGHYSRELAYLLASIALHEHATKPSWLPDESWFEIMASLGAMPNVLPTATAKHQTDVTWKFYVRLAAHVSPLLDWIIEDSTPDRCYNVEHSTPEAIGVRGSA